MDWIDINDRLPEMTDCVCAVKLKNGDEKKVYFHWDKMSWLAFFHKNHKLSHWQCYDSRKWLFDVTHWKPLPKKTKDE